MSMPRTVPESETRWIPRRMAAQRLGCSHSTLRRRIDAGELAWKRTADGHVLVDAHAVESMVRQGLAAPSQPGERTALAFRMLGEGASIIELSIALRLTVSEAEAYAEAHRRHGAGASLLAPEQVERLREAGIDARTVAELVDVSVSLAGRAARTDTSVKRKGVAA